MARDSTPDDANVVILPWWRNPINIVILAVGALFFAAAAGYSLGSTAPEETRHNSVDTGFLQDMRIHHEQAVVMSRLYQASAPPENTVLLTIAREIEIAQTFESGRFVQMLRTFGEAETNETDVAMSWMGHAMPLEQMDGMASKAELDRLAAARGTEAAKLFATLMIAHHEGGVAMADYAAEHGRNREVIAIAKSMARAQRTEIAEMRRILETL